MIVTIRREERTVGVGWLLGDCLLREGSVCLVAREDAIGRDYGVQVDGTAFVLWARDETRARDAWARGVAHAEELEALATMWSQLVMAGWELRGICAGGSGTGEDAMKAAARALIAGAERLLGIMR